MACTALFGASFNPPHLGHKAVLEDMLRQNLFEEIWLIPVYAHAFGKPLLPFADRVRYLDWLIEDIGSPQLKVLTIEQELNRTPSYTIDVVEELQRRHPQRDFVFVAGSDVKQDLPRWHRSEELQKKIRFHFIPRAGFEASPYPQVSSSEIRDKLSRGESLAGLTLRRIAADLEKPAKK